MALQGGARAGKMHRMKQELTGLFWRALVIGLGIQAVFFVLMWSLAPSLEHFLTLAANPVIGLQVAVSLLPAAALLAARLWVGLTSASAAQTSL
jgi:hypothetical protein